MISWEIYKETLRRMSTQKKYNFPHFLSNFFMENTVSVENIFKNLKGEILKLKEFLAILLGFSSKRVFYAFIESCLIAKLNNSIFGYLNQLIKNAEFVKEVESNSHIYSFLLDKASSYFFSYGLKLDNGFETYNFIEKVSY